MAKGLSLALLLMASLLAIGSTYNLRSRVVKKLSNLPNMPEELQWLQYGDSSDADDNNDKVNNLAQTHVVKKKGKKNRVTVEYNVQGDQSTGKADAITKLQKRLASCKSGNKFLKTKTRNLQQKFKLKLKAIKKIIINIFNDDEFEDPEIPMADVCSDKAGDKPVTEAPLNDDGDNGGGSDNTGSNNNNGGNDDSTGNTETQEPCVLTAWSEWNTISFGTIERSREKLREGCGCPADSDLKQTIDILPFLGNDTSTFEEPDTVGDNFHNNFLTNGTTDANGDVLPRDILVVLDSSGSITTEDFDLMKEGLITMIDLFCGQFGKLPTNNQLAIVQFSSNVTVIHRFNDTQDPQALKDKVMGLVHYKGNTCTGNALQTSMKGVFTAAFGMRAFTVKDTLIVTDGQSNCGIDIREAARDLQQVSNVFALGVGIADKEKARQEVESVVSLRDPNHIFSLAKFQDFKSMVDSLKKKEDRCTPIVDRR